LMASSTVSAVTTGTGMRHTLAHMTDSCSVDTRRTATAL
jgi:hypothetical protein